MSEMKRNPFDRYLPDGQNLDNSGNYEMHESYSLTKEMEDLINNRHEDENSASLFRSENMSLCQLFIQSEAGFHSVFEMGEAGVVQFRDMNEGTVAFQRKFVNEIRRCDEMERILGFLKNEIITNGLEIGEFTHQIIPSHQEMNELETKLEQLETELLEMNNNDSVLKTRYIELIELKHVLNKANFLFDNSNVTSHLSSVNSSIDMSSPNQDGTQEESVMVINTGETGVGIEVNIVAGVVPRPRLHAFESMLYRVSRGNAYMQYLHIEEALNDPLDSTGETDKSVFVIFFQGRNLKEKIQKICEGFKAKIYPCPTIAADRREVSTSVLTRISDLEVTLKETNDYRNRILESVSKNIKAWFLIVVEIKSIYHIMNMFRVSEGTNVMIAECWIPSDDVEQVRNRIVRVHRYCGSNVGPIVNKLTTLEDPPTFFRTNKYTSAFQALVDAYGVATTKELNPAVYTIVTFPFLFGVMFGDVGHAMIVLLFGVWMIVKERDLESRKINYEIWKMFFSGRYLITMMGIFALYAGFLYNDVFAKSFNIFGSSFQVYQENDHIMEVESEMIDPAPPYNESRSAGYFGTPYIFGIDPVWQLASNKIDFSNSIKLKLSIILGVAHMSFGILLSCLNHKYFKRMVSIWAEFLPQILFFGSLFGYLAYLIIAKWWLYSASNDPTQLARSEGCAPSVLIMFIDMFLFSTEEIEDGCESYFMGPYQQYSQYALVGIAVVSVPVMLLVKPFVQRREKNKISPELGHEATLSLEMIERIEKEKKSFDFGEVMILQGIHTIEFVLGCISHTASYLRLWALSLAHNQLSEVLYDLVLSQGFAIKEWYGSLLLYGIFAAWAAATVAVLVVMEGLSAFLHTLRLHWVEFQSKFYKGEGYPFEPFNLKERSKLAEFDFFGS